MAPGERLPKSSRKSQKSLTPQILTCSSVKEQNPKNQQKPQDGDTPAKDQEKEHRRANLEEQTGNKRRLRPWPYLVH